MTGIMTMLGDGKLTVLQVLAERIKFDQFDPAVIPEYEEMGKQATPEFEKRKSEYADAVEAEQRDLAEAGRLKKDASERFTKQLLMSADEAASTLSNCDTPSVASRLRTIQDALQVWQDVEDLLMCVRVPAARLQTLEVNLSLRKVEELLAGIAAGLIHARTLNVLIKGGIYRADNQVGILSEEVQNLRALAEQAEFRTKQAAVALRDEQQRQFANAQARMAVGLTRIEAATCQVNN